MNQKTYSAVPFAVLRKLRLVRQRKVWVHVASAMVAAITVLVAAMGVAMLIDYLATLYDSGWRVVLTAAALGAAALTSAGWLVMAFRRRLGLERIATDVDREIPQLAERWTTMTRLGSDADDPQVMHPAMLRRVATEAASWEPHVEPQQIISMSTLMRAMLCLTAVTAVLGIAVVLDSQRTLVLLKRFWMPGSSISATQLVNVQGNVVVGRGEPLALAAEVEGIPVERATLFVRSAANPQREIVLVAHGQSPIEFSHRVRTVEEPFDYRFRAGDGQTDWYTVGVADRPEIEKVQLTVTPPAYTRQPAKTFDKLPQRVSALEKSSLELALRPKAPVKSIELQLGNDKSVRLAVDEDGWFRWDTTLGESFTLTPVLTEPHGLTNRRPPKCQFMVYEDRPPTVKVLTPNEKVAVRPDDTIQIAFSASDDVGIESAELLVYDEAAVGEEPAPIASIPIPLGEQAGARSVQESVALDLNKFLVEDGMELSYEIRVREDRGGSQAQSTASPEELASDLSASPPKMTQNAENQLKTAGPSSRPQVASRENKAEISQTAATPTDTANQQTGSKSRQAAADGAKPKASRAPRVLAGHSKSAGPGAGELKSGSPPSQDLAAGTPTGRSDSPPKSESRPDVSAPRSTDAREAGNPSKGGEKRVKNETAAEQEVRSDTASSPNKVTEGEQSPRTATTGRQSLSGNRTDQPAQQASSTQNSQSGSASSNETRNNAAPTSASRQQANDSPQQRSNTAQASRSAAQQSNAGQQSQQNGQAMHAGEQQPSSQGDPPPGDDMPRRALDIAQSASSQRMRLSVDEWAGSFEGQQRSKLEMAISPELAALDRELEKGQKTARGVLDELEADAPWRGTHDRDVSSAEHSTVEAQELVTKLQERTADTPYAFIGLQVTDIGLAHIGPARSGFWKALESEGEDRVTSVRDAWQHLGRARQLVAELRGQYERTRREFQLAESVEKVKKMYQVYLENSQALLQTQDSDPTRYARKMAQFELDEEYLKRLKEVLEMRRDLQAELARILAEDPRLLRRFMDALRYRSNNLREELAGIIAEQIDLNREVRAWTLADDADRPKIAKMLLLKQVQDASKIATAAGELQSRYQTWLPLDRESKDEDLAAATKTIQEMATAASELGATAQKFVADSQRAAVKSTAQQAEASAAESEAAPAENDSQRAIDAMLTDAESLYEWLNKLDVTLRQLAAREEGAEAALFAANRLVDTRRLVADSSAWVRQIRAHKAGSYTGAAKVDQYRLAMKTDQLAGKLGALEQSLAALLQRQDGKLPAPIAEKAREFLATLDRQVSPNQLASVHALHGNQLPRATQRQKAASEALTKAEQAYDDLMRLAIEELDKLSVQDPVADLLDDPTLDELLAQLEHELPIDELLGIPNRPSNLRIIADWLRPGSSMGGGSGQMVMNQMRQDEERARQQLNRAYQRALARAIKESTPQRIEVPRPAKLSDWNRLVSKLGDHLGQGRDKAPPEQYRRAIEQYFSQISSVVAENENESQ
ncbi:MAG TPA: hypothetical protein VGK58_19870 [Lacipirellulaceae bacterium]